MNSLTLAPSFLFLSTAQKSLQCIQLCTNSTCYHHNCFKWPRLSLFSLSSSSIQPYLLQSRQLSVHATLTPDQGEAAILEFEDLVEKDWSILDRDDTTCMEECDRKNDRIIAAGNIGETSKVLVSLGSNDFMDRLVDTSPCQFLLLVHESLFLLAGVKERYDRVKCWQGELIYAPEKWAPFDAAFLYFVAALPFKLDEVFRALSSRCSPGARVVISHPQGRQVLEQQRQQFPDVVISDLPDKTSLEKVAADHYFLMNEFVDEPGIYLAVLEKKV